MSGMKSDVFEIITDCSKHSDWKGTLSLEGNVYLSNEIVSSQSKVGGVSFSLTVLKGHLDIFKVLTNPSHHMVLNREGGDDVLIKCTVIKVERVGEPQ